MEINKQQTPVDEPVMEIDQVCLREMTDAVRAIPDQKTTRDTLKLTYDLALTRLHNLLEMRSSSSWVLEAYKQSFMWTLVLRDGIGNFGFEAPKELAPVGRYGWRYVIEFLLKKENLNSLSRMPPSYSDVKQAFTLLAVLATSAEWLDLTHSFSDVYSDVYFDLTEEYGLLMPILSQKVENTLAERQQYMKKTELTIWQKYLSRWRDEISDDIEPALNLILNESYGFTVDQLREVIDALGDTALASGVVIILPGSYLIDWVSEEGKIDRELVKKVINFMLLSHSALKETNRDFFNKRNPLRMINYAGVRIDRLKNLKSIYPKKAISEQHVKSATWHVIINIMMVGEWLDVFLHKCANGQRQDLKSNPKLNQGLERIEQHQRRNVFESIVANIFRDQGYSFVKSLKKFRNNYDQLVQLPCGEIDVIAFNPASKILFIVECKASAPATDSRGYFQQHQDHFKQKKYHSKFLSKIEWVENNLEYIKSLDELARSMSETTVRHIVPVMVTRYPNIVKFYVKEYPVITFAELEDFISKHSQK